MSGIRYNKYHMNIKKHRSDESERCWIAGVGFEPTTSGL